VLFQGIEAVAEQSHLGPPSEMGLSNMPPSFPERVFRHASTISWARLPEAADTSKRACTSTFYHKIKGENIDVNLLLSI